MFWAARVEIKVGITLREFIAFDKAALKTWARRVWGIYIIHTVIYATKIVDHLGFSKCGFAHAQEMVAVDTVFKHRFALQAEYLSTNPIRSESQRDEFRGSSLFGNTLLYQVSDIKEDIF